MYPWTTTQQHLTDMGVTEDPMHLSIGIEHIEYIKENIYRVFASIDVSQLPTASIQAQLLHQQEQKRVVQALFRPDPLLLSVVSIWYGLNNSINYQ